MSQNIHFQNVVMNRMEIKVRGFPGRILIIGWILYRRKVVDTHVIRHDDDFQPGADQSFA